MAYIEVRTTLPDHRKAKAAARELTMRRPWLIGHLVCLWAWALDNVPADGSLAGIDDADLEEAAQWPEDRAGELVPAMVRAGFVDVDATGRYLHDWDDYAGRLLRRREEDRDRKRQERAAARGEVQPAACPGCGRTDVIEKGRIRTHYRREQLAGTKWTKTRCEASGTSLTTTRGGRGDSGRPADKAARPSDTSERPQEIDPTPHGPRTRVRRTTPHPTVPTEETPPTPSAATRKPTRRSRAAAESLSFDPAERPDLAALVDRGWRVSQAQADDLAEIANNERPSEHDVRGGFEAIAGWVSEAPKRGDLHRYLLDRENGLKADRLAAADAAEADWTEAKASAPALAPELVAGMTASGSNGHAGRLSREELIEKFRPYRGEIADELLEHQLVPHGLTLADLEDPVDFEPAPPQEDPHG